MLSSAKPLYERLLDVAIAHLQSTANLDLEGFMRESRTALTNDQVREMKLDGEHTFVSIEQAFLEAIEKGEIQKVHAKFAAHSYIALAQVGNY